MSRQFGYRCRGCGETSFLEPPSTVRCAWCEISDPFGGDTHKTRPTFEELSAVYAGKPIAQPTIKERT